MYKALIRSKNVYYIHKKQEQLFQLSKLYPKNTLRQIITHKTK
jgi:hypothetical protein